MILKMLEHRLELVFIHPDDWGLENYGDFDSQRLKIRIVQDLQKDVFMTSFLHELTHFKQHIFGLEMSEDEANRDALFWYGALKSSRLIQKVWKAYTE